MADNNKSIVSGLRSCSYNPVPDMIQVTYADQNRTEAYLEVKFRVLWFHQYCNENNKVGVIDDSEVVYIPEASMFRATASVYIDGVLVGKSSAGVPYSPNVETSSRAAIQTAATCAKGRALANAGFGTTNCQVDDGERFPCDSGIIIQGGRIVQNPMNPLEMTFVMDEEGNDKEPETSPTNPPADQQASAVQPSEPGRMTLEEAKAVVLPIGNSDYKGKTLGQVLAINRGIIEFYASAKFNNPRYPELKQAAQVIVQAMNKS